MFENIGIGVDIVEINRFKEKPFEKIEVFIKNIFWIRDRILFTEKNSAETFASKFAIKEAVIKAIKKQ